MPSHSRKKTVGSTIRVPAAYARVMLEIATSRGLTPQQVLEGTHLDPVSLERPDLRIPAREAAVLTHNVVALTGLDGIGFEVGLRIKPTTHGYFGYAAMSCATLRDAVELISEHLLLRTSDFVLRTHLEQETIVLDVVQTRDLGLLRHMLHEGLMTVLYQNACCLLGERIEGCEMWFEWTEPAYVAGYRDRLPALRYGQPANQLRMPSAYLDRPLEWGDPAAATQALEQLQREGARSGIRPQDLLPRVRAELVPEQNGYPNLESIAAKLFMSGRTLKRKLQKSGSSFQKLLDETRRKEALRLMKNPELDLQTVSSMLGYAEPICFTRAFRRWTGKAPSDYRDYKLIKPKPP